MKQPSRTQILFFIAAMLVIFSGAYLVDHFGLDQQGSETGSLPVHEVAPTKVDEEVTAEQTEETPRHETQKTAKRIVLVPDTRKATPDEVNEYYQTEISGNNIVDVTMETLEKALGGDLVVAYRINDLFERCDSPYIDGAGLEKAIERATRSAAHIAERGDPIGLEGRTNVFMPGKRMYPTEELNRMHLTAWYEGCGKLRDIFSNDLRQQLDELAQQGDVMARYLYAIWAPTTSMTVSGLDLELDWSRKALEYSYLNLEEGEAAGFLALGQSYHDSLFTRENRPLAKVLFLVALECGVKDPNLALRVAFWSSIRVGYDTVDGKQEELERIMSVAQELAGACR